MAVNPEGRTNASNGICLKVELGIVVLLKPDKSSLFKFLISRRNRKSYSFIVPVIVRQVAVSCICASTKSESVPALAT